MTLCVCVCVRAGRGESYLEMARLALEETFDGRAVDYVTLALRDVTVYVSCMPVEARRCQIIKY